MTPDLALLEAVRDRPEDDLPRLVYADWCEENGQPDRAEFIRVQCELAKLAEEDPRRDALVKRQEELISPHRAEWIGPLAEHYADSVTFQRGFADQIFLYLDEKRHPVIRPLTGTLATAATTGLQVYVDPRTPFHLGKLIDRMTCWPALRSLRQLDIWPGRRRFHARHLRQLVRNPHLSGVKDLGVYFRFTAALLPLFATATFANRLTRLLIGIDGDRDEWCQAWVRLPFVPRLEWLDISGGGFDDSRMATFLTADPIRVTAADLSSNQLTAQAFHLLARWPGCGRLTRLDIEGNPFGPHPLSRLVDLPLGQLRDLSVGESQTPTVELADGEWRRFAESPLADRLTKLSVRHVSPGSSFVRELSAGTFRSLTDFYLSDTLLDPAALRTLATAPWFRQLRWVHFGHYELRDEHAEAFLQAELNDRAILGFISNRFSDAAKQKLRDHFGHRVRV